jgi:hypothetical protein
VTQVIYVENGVGRAVHDALALFTGNHGWDVRWQHDIHPDMQRAQNGDQWWITDITARGWAILTQDRAILNSGAERDTVEQTGARIVAYTDAEYQRWDKLRVLAYHWPAIDRELRAGGPVAISVSLSGAEVDRFGH